VTASEAKLAYEAAKAAHDAATAALDKIERRGVEPWLDQGLATATTIYQAKRSAAKRKRQATAATLERATFALSAAVAVGRADAARQAAEEAEAEAIEAAQGPPPLKRKPPLHGRMRNRQSSKPRRPSRRHRE
jgi:hypothetical protein